MRIFKTIVLLIAFAVTWPAHSIEVLPLLTTTKSWIGSPLPGFRAGQTEFKILKFKLEPGNKTSIHTHPLNGAGYILSGELTMYATEDPYGKFDNPKHVKKIKLAPGDTWAEAVNVWHYGVNEGNTDLEFIVVFTGEEGTPPSISLGTHHSSHKE